MRATVNRILADRDWEVGGGLVERGCERRKSDWFDGDEKGLIDADGGWVLYLYDGNDAGT